MPLKPLPTKINSRQPIINGRVEIAGLKRPLNRPADKENRPSTIAPGATSKAFPQRTSKTTVATKKIITTATKTGASTLVKTAKKTSELPNDAIQTKSKTSMPDIQKPDNVLSDLSMFSPLKPSAAKEIRRETAAMAFDSNSKSRISSSFSSSASFTTAFSATANKPPAEIPKGKLSEKSLFTLHDIQSKNDKNVVESVSNGGTLANSDTPILAKVEKEEIRNRIRERINSKRLFNVDGQEINTPSFLDSSIAVHTTTKQDVKSKSLISEIDNIAYQTDEILRSLDSPIRIPWTPQTVMLSQNRVIDSTPNYSMTPITSLPSKTISTATPSVAPISTNTGELPNADDKILSSAPVSTNMDISPNIDRKILSSVIEDALVDVYERVHRDVQNMHLELLKQFMIQQTSLENIIGSYLGTELVQLRNENERLRRENERLKRP